MGGRSHNLQCGPWWIIKLPQGAFKTQGRSYQKQEEKWAALPEALCSRSISLPRESLGLHFWLGGSWLRRRASVSDQLNWPGGQGHSVPRGRSQQAPSPPPSQDSAACRCYSPLCSWEKRTWSTDFQHCKPKKHCCCFCLQPEWGLFLKRELASPLSHTATCWLFASFTSRHDGTFPDSLFRWIWKDQFNRL